MDKLKVNLALENLKAARELVLDAADLIHESEIDKVKDYEFFILNTYAALNSQIKELIKEVSDE